MAFRNRAEAGRLLGARLVSADLERPVILGLVRGGVPIAAEVARGFMVGFDAFVARKIGLPGQVELGIGAVAEGLSEPVYSSLAGQSGLSGAELSRLAATARAELERRVLRYRGDRPLPRVEGRDVVLVDDGIATGITALAALTALRERRPRRLVLGAGVCARATVGALAKVADAVVGVEVPAAFFAVGQFYEDFSEITDEEVIGLLTEGTAERNR
jgi:putative phosphoribosyl transferase